MSQSRPPRSQKVLRDATLGIHTPIQPPVCIVCQLICGASIILYLNQSVKNIVEIFLHIPIPEGHFLQFAVQIAIGITCERVVSCFDFLDLAIDVVGYGRFRLKIFPISRAVSFSP